METLLIYGEVLRGDFIQELAEARPIDLL